MKPASRRRAKRGYVMGERSAAVAERRGAVLDAALELLLQVPYDELSLQAIAMKSGVSLKTVVRQFGTKEGLLLEVARHASPREREQRRVPAGDVARAARVLADRYEALGTLTRSLLEIERRIGAIRESLAIARKGHLEWLASTFAASLPPRGAVRRRRLACLFGATEIYVWTSWREHLGMSRVEAEAALRESLAALVDSFDRGGAQ